MIPPGAAAKPCLLSHPYGMMEACTGSPPCALSAPPAELQGELVPAAVVQNSTHYNGSIFLDADALAWTDVDIEGNRLAVSWWAGLRLYDISDPTVPVEGETVDGYLGDFPSWLPPLSEIDQVFSAVAIPDGDATFAVLGGIQPGGFAIVDVADPGAPVVRYQDETTHVLGTIWAAHVGGRSYGFAGTSLGVYVYDLTRAREIGCVRQRQGLGGCAGVRSGPFGSATNYVNGALVDGGAILVRSSGVYFPKTIEVWDVSDPTMPVPTASLAGSTYFGVAAWEQRDASHTVYVAGRGLTSLDVFVYNGGVLIPAGNEPLTYIMESAQYLPLSFSFSGDVPFVFAGHADGCREAFEPPAGTEKLLRMADPHHPETFEIADVSPRQLEMFTSWTSPDPDGMPPPPEATRTVDYWSWYTPNHEWGWGSVWPRTGKFTGDYFFRAAHTIGDVHRWVRPPDPNAIFADSFETGTTERWLEGTSPEP